MTHLYRIVYRPGNGAEEYQLHTGRKGTSIYLSIGAARSAVTQFRRQDRFYGGGTVDYKIQQVPLGEWEDVDSGNEEA